MVELTFRDLAADAEAFLNELGRDLPADERLILNKVRGDPGAAAEGAFRPLPWRPGMPLEIAADMNAYVAVSSFRRAADGTWRRRQEGFAAGRAFMIDDVDGRKVPFAVLDELAPTALIETSPGNCQAWFFYSEPQRDIAAVQALTAAFIAQRLAGKDPGMAGANRVGRLPGFRNGKPQYGGAFRTVLRQWEPDRRFSIAQIAAAFGLTLAAARPVYRRPPSDGRIEVQIELFKRILEWLHAHGMIKGDLTKGGWIEITCPWVDYHSGKKNTGAAIRIPEEENAWNGAFRCHHSTHCAGRGWNDLADWIWDHQSEESFK